MLLSDWNRPDIPSGSSTADAEMPWDVINSATSEIGVLPIPSRFRSCSAVCSPCVMAPPAVRETSHRPGRTSTRPSVTGRRARNRDQTRKVVDRAGLREGGLLSDIFSMNGRRILNDLSAKQGRDAGAKCAPWYPHHWEQERKLIDTCEQYPSEYKGGWI